MPRPKSTVPRLVRKAERQAKYRARLQEAGRPEASQVDVAVAAATAKAVRWLVAGLKDGKIGERDARRSLLDNIVADSARILIDSGCSADEASAKLRSRLRSAGKPRFPPITP
ncbi:MULTISPECIES: hypothetical protein [Rhizobium]|uniref:hypothetical protein n=1 Tax=Rhizobium TaxID=379 RepID=UPI0003FBFED7|nr:MULTISPECIES: hypothetical protein [Rhizobium]MBB3520962.1 hypothetical protein [Rhizobium sp. BK456]UFS81525.1 hypothetical protein LPB79_24960 [Rhizobium sp. T136]